MRAAIILVGDELLAGQTRDANAHFLAQRLYALGHRLRHVAIVPDEARGIQDEVELALQRAEVVFVSGGLGPTHDDRTTEALATRFNRQLVVDEPSWRRLQVRYGKRVEATPDTVEAARKMVTVPEGCEVLENPVGAAPGYVLREGAAAIIVFPGVPAELQAMFEQKVVGKLLPMGTRIGLVEVDLDMPEAAFALALGRVAERFGDIDIGSYPHFGERRVTLRFRGDEGRAAEALEAFLSLVPDARGRLLGKTEKAGP